jgi:hypothetical protein
VLGCLAQLWAHPGGSTIQHQEAETRVQYRNWFDCAASHSETVIQWDAGPGLTASAETIPLPSLIS